jgi:hypothetical protein
MRRKWSTETSKLDDHFVVYLLDNLGLTGKKLEDAKRSATRFGQIYTTRSSFQSTKAPLLRRKS